MYGATASVGFVAGQVLGGVLVEFTSWRVDPVDGERVRGQAQLGEDRARKMALEGDVVDRDRGSWAPALGVVQVSGR